MHILRSMEEKECKRCKRPLPISSFSLNKYRNTVKLRNTCRQCRNEDRIRWAKSHPEKEREMQRNARYEGRYRVVSHNQNVTFGSSSNFLQ